MNRIQARSAPPLTSRIAALLFILCATGSVFAQDDRWSDEFNVPGLLGGVVDTVDFRGQLVAAGTIGAGKGAFMDSVGSFDGSRWHALPGTFVNFHQYPYNTYLLAMTVFQNDLIVAGRFTSVGQAVGAYCVARFDGVRWWSLGQGLPGAADVNALCVFNGELYAGGNFGGVNVPYGIARWNGTSWVAVGGQMQFPSEGVQCMRVAIDGSLWVSGDFTQIGALQVNGLARWTGTQWQAIGSTPVGGGFATGTVLAIEEFQGRMVVGGGFYDPGNLVGVAAWNGTAFVPLGNGSTDFVQGTVNALRSTARGLYIGGDFGFAGGLSVFDLVRFDGTTWHDDGGDDDGGFAIYSRIYSLDEWQGKLVVGGEFNVIGSGPNGGRGRAASGIATFDGSEWGTLGDGLGMSEGGDVLDIVPWRGGWAVVGNFNHGGAEITSRLSWFDGRRHHRVAEFDSVIAAACVWQGDLVVSGSFTHVNGAPATRTMRFDGASWTSMGNILASDFAEYQGSLHASIGGIARWNGSTWQVLAQIAESHDLAVFQNKLYLAGQLSLFQTDGLFTWDGATFQTVPGGPTSRARALLARGNELWVGGEFATCGSTPTRCLARFNGSSFSQVGTGIAGPLPGIAVRTLAELDGQVYLGGEFSSATGGPGNAIARWDGSAFRTLGNGVNGTVGSIVPDPITGDLLVGGTFFTARGTATSVAATIPCSELGRYRTRDDFADLGQALPGALGPAELVGRGDFQLGGYLGWRLSGAPSSALGVHVFALRRSDLQLFGGVLVPTPDVALGFTASSLGTAEFLLGVPVALPVGTPFFVQCWFLDASTPSGLAASNALTTSSR